MALPQPFIEHLREKGYHPRSNKHSNALGDAIVADLLAHCEAICKLAADGDLVYDLNFDLISATSQWNVDLVLGPPPPDTPAPDSGLIVRMRPTTVQIAIELKSVMTEHRKAIKNRKRDFEAHHEHVHRYGRDVIAGGVLVVNASETFMSPLRQEPTTHKNPSDLVRHCLQEMRNVSFRHDQDGTGLDAKSVVVVSMDNLKWAETGFADAPPAPLTGDPLHYDAFIQRVCARFSAAYARD